MAKNKLSSRRTAGSILTTEQQEKAFEKLKKEKVKEKGKYYGRVTVDFPAEVYENMKDFVKEDGRTLRGYIISLVKKDLKNRD